MSATTVRQRPDTHDMVVVHRLFRREFRLLPELVAAVPPGDTARAGLLAEHVDLVTTALHHHHEGEDELLWPKLLQRATVQTALIERMESQHGQLSAVLDDIQAVLPQFTETAAPEARDRLADALRRASGTLDEHLGEEEREILPLVEEHLSVEEWAELGKRGGDGIPMRKMLQMLGMLLEDADPQERRQFLAHLPLVARLMWRAGGERRYAAYVASLRTA